MLKRVISFLLCVNILVSMLPVQSFATEDVTESTEQIVTTEPLEETTEPSEAVTEPSEEVTMPTVAVTEPTEEITVPTEFVVEVTEPEATTESEPVCTGFVDCPVSDHDDGCEKKLADEKMFADQAAADGVMVLIAELPTLEELQEKPMAEQGEVYEQVQVIYGQYCTLSVDQQALLPPADEVFKPYFDYFNSLVSLTWSGSGTSSKPFLISTEQELRSLAQQVNSGNTYRGTYFRLANDIALTSDWTPIGTDSYKFRGTFDGNNCTISGMTVTGSYVGLFGYLGSDAVIKNLNLKNFSVTGPEYLAGLVAYADAGTGTITISDCHADGSVRDNEDSYPDGYLAGIVAYADAESGTIIIRNCTSDGSYICDYYSGGIVGYGKGKAHSLKLQNCTNYAHIDADDDGNNCGGIAGSLSSAELESCLNYGSVSGNAYSEDNGSSWLGGITGYGSNCIFNGCANYGNISTFFAGGITASQSGGNVANSCLNVGTLNHSSDGYGYALLNASYTNTVINSYYLYGRGINGAEAVSGSKLASGEVAHALRDYFGQTIGTDSYPVPLTANNRVYKVTVMGEASGSYYTNYGKTISLPELSSCTAYFVGDSKFDPTTPITRDYALAAKGYHNYVDGVCIYCGNEGVDYVDVGSCGDSLAWTLTENGVLKISGTGAMTNYSASNPAPWSAYLSSIQSVEIGTGATVVGDYAFKGLTNVTAITLADTVTEIGKYAFNGMTKLAAVTIGDSVTNIGDYAFGSCSSLTSLSFGKQLKTIGNYAFYQCTSLDSVSIPGNVTALGNSAFRDCSALDYIWLGSALNLKTIGAYAFSGTAITDQRIPEAVSSIGDYAFANCSALGKISFQGSAPEISATAFSGVTSSCSIPNYDSSWESKVNKNYGGTLTWAIGSGTSWDGLSWILDFNGTLTISGSGEMSDYGVNYGEGTAPWGPLSEQICSVVIADGVTSIGDYAFYKCANLHSVSIADSVTTIGTVYKYSGYSCVFLDCTSLTQITIPGNVTAIGYDDFNGCTSLTSIDVAYGNTAFSSSDGVLYDRYKDTLYCYPAGKTGAFTIPSSVDNIAPYAFSKCTALQEIEIPAAVTFIGRAAFGSCKNLSRITFEGSAPTIESSAFSSVTATVDYPYTDSTWTADMLQNYGGTLTWNGGIGSCGTGVQWQMTYTRGSAVLVISGSGAMDDYTADTLPWKEHLNSIKTVEVCDGVTSIGAYALYSADSLTTVKLADSVKSVGNYAFGWCSNLKYLTLGNGVQTIGDLAFTSTVLTALTFPDSLKSIGTNAFNSCSSLKSVTFGSNMQTIGYLAFGSCTALETVNLGSSVTTLDQYAFNNCGKLKKIVIPASVTSIGAYAFRWCYDLQYVEFLGNAPTIGSYAFTDVNANAYYVSSKSGWTSSKMANYGGTLTWGAISQRGSCGTSAEWILDTSDNLYICGSGTMSNYSATSSAPWYAYRSSIKKVTLRGITSIGAYAFSGCSALNQVAVPSGISSVGNYAFADCSGLQVVMFDGSAPSFGANTFSGTTCEMWYQNSWSSSVRKDYGGTLTWRSTTARGSCGTNSLWALDSTGTLTVLGTGAMANYASVSYQPWYNSNTSIKSVIIGDAITSVGNYAFRSCTALESVTIGESVSSIESYAFYGCSALKTITFLGGAPSFSSYVFTGVTATAFYPLANSTWTSSKLQNYGGTLNWQAVCIRHQETVVPAVAATCTNTGLTEGSYCSLCSEVLVAQTVIPAKGHFVIGPDNTEVSADSFTADCVKTYYCTVCKGVGKAAAGHRVLGTTQVEADPLTISNTSSYPFTLTDGTYYSTNTNHNSSSDLNVTAQYACSLTVRFGVSSEEDYDKLSILKNNVSQRTISGEVENETLTLTLKAGDVVTVRYKKDSSSNDGQDRGWAKLIYDPVMVDTIGDVSADTAEPDCTNAVVCRYCQTVVKEALGHRVIRPLPEPECPYDVINTSAVPFVLTDGTYYSANHGGGSSSELQIKANKACTLTLTYGVYSEQTYDKLTILHNGTAQDTISGDVSSKTLTMNLTAGEILTVCYSKDSSVNKDPDQGWVSIEYDKGPLEEIVPADSVEVTCSGVICDYCQAVVKEALPHTEVIDAGIAPTCTESGLTEGKHCSVCNDVLIAQEVVNALGHTEVTDAGIAATCTESGITEGKHCSVCGTVLIAQETINALGHTEVIDSSVAATCTENGLTEGKHCSACNEVFVAQETINALGHTEVTDSSVAATCTESGLTEGKHCSVCDEVIVAQETIPAAGHTAVVDAAVSATCTEDGLTEGTHCSVCQEILVAQEKIPAAHVEVVDPAVEATCTASGLTEGKHCSVCNEVLVAQEVIPAGHTVENGICTQCGLAILGNNLIWTLDENGTLTISGSGPMPDFEDEYEQPWYYQASSIKKVVIQDGITEIGNYAFCLCRNITEISVPDSVTSFGSRAFSGCNSLTSIEIPAEQKTIWGFMFSGCSSLTSITIPDGVTSIGDNAFAGSGLTSLVIPDSVMTIGNRAFDGCIELEEVVIGKNVRSLYERAFAYCSSLTAVHFTGSAPGAGANNVFAFSPVTAYYPGTNSSWTEQARQNISYNATWVPYDPCEKGHNYGEDDQCTVCGKAKPFASGQCGESLFWEYDGEGTITITGTGTMYDYTGEKPWEAYEEDITTVVIGAGVTSIGYCAFMSCSELNSVSLPDTLTQISAHGFSYCPALEQIQLPDSLKEIDHYAFSSTGLKSLHLGRALQQIGEMNPFAHNSSLRQITIAEDNLYFAVKDNVLFTKEMTKLICYPGGLSQESYTVPDGVISIGDSAFRENTNIKTVILPETLEILEDQAFFSCDSLCQLELPSGLQKLGSVTLAHTSLEQIVIPASVTSIGHLAFSNISTLESITFEGDAPEIHSGAFGNDSGGTVTTAYYPSNNPTWTEDKLQNYGGNITWVPYNTEHTHEYGDDHKCECGAIGGTCGDNLIWVLSDGMLNISGTGNMEEYSGSSTLFGEPWASYRSQIQTVFIDAGVTSVDRSLFYYNKNLTAIYVDENNPNYSDNDGILFSKDETVLIWMPPVITGTYQIADSVKTIGAYAFSECDDLTSVVIPDSVTSIECRAFAALKNLTSVTIGNGVTQIGDSVFYLCTSLTDLILGNSVEIIGFSAFYNCGMTSLVIPDSTTYIGQFAFQGCPFMTLTLGNSVQHIGYWAFSQCPNLTNVVLPASVRSIDDGVFWRCSALSEVRFQGEAPDFADGAFSGVNATTYYPANNDTWTEEMRQNYGGTLTWVPYSDIENRLILDSEAFSSYDSVWIDGAEMAIQKDGNCWYIDLPDGNARIMTTYTYGTDGAAEDGVDAHSVYPVSMRVWTLENQNGVYSATRQNAFDDILQYSGISIRITGKQGIRMITSIDENNRNALTGDGLAGYTVKEYGTAIAWAKQLSSTKPLVVGKSYVSSNYAYKKNVADPIFRYVDGRIQYTNVLVGFSLDNCKDDIAMRSYMILTDANGDDVIIYGGIVERSIGYIALRNRFRYPNYSDYYNYVWDIIRHVYGNSYDADWRPEWSDTIM